MRDVMNKYAPNTYYCKYPNDVVCIEHQAKTFGGGSRVCGKLIFINFLIFISSWVIKHLLKHF